MFHGSVKRKTITALLNSQIKKKLTLHNIIKIKFLNNSISQYIISLVSSNGTIKVNITDGKKLQKEKNHNFNNLTSYRKKNLHCITAFFSILQLLCIRRE